MSGPGLNLILLEKSQTCELCTACHCNTGAKVTVSGGSVGTLPQTEERRITTITTLNRDLLFQYHSPDFQLTTAL